MGVASVESRLSALGLRLAAGYREGFSRVFWGEFAVAEHDSGRFVLGADRGKRGSLESMVSELESSRAWLALLQTLLSEIPQDFETSQFLCCVFSEARDARVNIPSPGSPLLATVGGKRRTFPPTLRGARELAASLAK